MRILRYTCFFVALLTCGAAVAADDLDGIRDYLDRGMYRTAVPLLDAFLADHPDNSEAWALLARYRFETEDPEGASKAAEKAKNLENDEADHWVLCGRAAFEVGRRLYALEKPDKESRAWFAYAESAFRKAQQLYPDHPEVIWRIGWAMEWQGNRGSARQFYELHIDHHPDRPGGYGRLAVTQLSDATAVEDQKSDKAKRLREQGYATFERGIGTAGEHAALLFDYADAVEQAGDDARAFQLYVRSLRADPGFAKPWNRADRLAKPPEVMVGIAIEVLKTHPTATEAVWRAGYATNRRQPRRGEKEWKRHEEALGYLLPALERNGDHEGLYTEAFRAACVLLGKSPSTAPSPKVGTDASSRIHVAYKWSGDSANNLGFYYREARKYGLSLSWYLKACERAPENQDILNDTGLIYLFHVPAEKEKGLPYFVKTVALVEEGPQKPERGYWDALENLAKHYWEVDRQPEKVVEYARMRYLTTKGVKPYNMSQKAAKHAALAKKALRK